jgi:hypothetical protein
MIWQREDSISNNALSSDNQAETNQKTVHFKNDDEIITNTTEEPPTSLSSVVEHEYTADTLLDDENPPDYSSPTIAVIEECAPSAVSENISYTESVTELTTEHNIHSSLQPLDGIFSHSGGIQGETNHETAALIIDDEIPMDAGDINIEAIIATSPSGDTMPTFDRALDTDDWRLKYAGKWIKIERQNMYEVKCYTTIFI